MHILGISYGYTATATLLKDGRVIACASEERFNEIKNYNGFPKQAIDYCLKEAGIIGSDLDLVSTPYIYLPPSHLLSNLKSKSEKISKEFYLRGFLGKARSLFRYLRYKFPVLRPLGMVTYRMGVFIIGAYYTRRQRNQIAEYLGIDISKIKSYDHHLCHATASYYSSPFNKKKALVLTLDGEGDNYCASVSIFNARKIKIISRTPREFSLGYIYGHITKFLGMKPHEHEYKVMGLAPYAKDEMVEKIYKQIYDTISFNQNDKLQFTMPFNSQDYYLFLRQNFSETRFDYLAGAFQKLVEEKVRQWVKAAIKKTRVNSVVLSGGVFMNIKVNQIITNLPEVKDIYIMPSCADESAQIGSCYLGYLELNQDKTISIEPISNLYWGPSYTNKEVLKIIKGKRYYIKKPRNMAQEIAQLLNRGEIVAVMMGRMEWGARALGNRSILANPQNAGVVKEINEMIKNRDFWMPFAPTILKERMNDYLLNPKKIESLYMMIGFDSTPLARNHLIAALHPYDETLRPQIITKELNPGYYHIIKEFEKITGIGGVLNTSFNLHGYPIVLGPKQALYVFENSGLKYLAAEDYLISKR